MTVVEKHDDAEREIIREEVRAELAHERRDKRLRGCGCALLAFAVLIGAPIGVTVWLIAKSGLADIPVITSAVYVPPAPIRQVLPLVGTTAETVAKSLVAKAKPGAATGTAEVAITEQELTTILDAAVKSGGLPPLPLVGTITSAQAAVTPDFIEFYMSGSQTGGKVVPVIIRVKPIVTAGKLSFQIQEAVFGAMPLPAALLEPVLNQAADAAMSKAVGGTGTMLVSTKLDQGRLTLTLAAAR